MTVPFIRVPVRAEQLRADNQLAAHRNSTRDVQTRVGTVALANVAGGALPVRFQRVDAMRAGRSATEIYGSGPHASAVVKGPAVNEPSGLLSGCQIGWVSVEIALLSS